MRHHRLVSLGVLAALCACGQAKTGSLPAAAGLKHAAFQVQARSTPAAELQMQLGGRAINHGFQTLYQFANGVTDAAGVQAKMTKVNGLFYGTAHGGGQYGYGAVFTFDPNTNAEQVIYSFTDGADGWGPEALLTSYDGILYGTSASVPEPGFPDGQGNGAVWAMSTSGAIQVLHSFTGSPDGANPEGFVTEVNGMLYGTTFVGGTGRCSYTNSSGCGTVFSVNPQTGEEQVIYSFTGSPDGAGPRAGLINVNGTLYGSTYYGGAGNDGTVFSITPEGNEAVVHSFTGGSDGVNPQSALSLQNGFLFGTTNRGGNQSGGIVYRISPTTKSEKVVASVCCGPEGGVNGSGHMLYLTTSGDGEADSGNVLAVSTSGTQQKLYQFTGGTNGGAPEDALTMYNGRLYGTTRLSGANGAGTIFKIRP